MIKENWIDTIRTTRRLEFEKREVILDQILHTCNGGRQWWHLDLRTWHGEFFFLEFISDIWIQKIGIFFIIKKNPFSNVLNFENLLKEADELMIVDWWRKT